MCGIAGILGPRGDGGQVREALSRMQRSLRHRGPDDQGLFISDGGDAGFAHTRLSILDLSLAGHQPMVSADGKWTIVFNGEIYNYLQLRTELEQRGEVFRSRTDTEVILALWRHYGESCLCKLRGMFAFAVWSEQSKTCWLARDPLGIKPLYYAPTPSGSLVFASEVRTILACDLVKRKLSCQAIYEYLLFGSVPEPLTVHEPIRALQAGHYFKWNGSPEAPRQYWELRFGDQVTNRSEAIHIVRDALLSSVRSHLVSDVPVGLFLSGGIDSSALLALLKQAGAGQVRTFCISFEDRLFNEGGVASRTAAHFGAAHSDWRLEAAEGRMLVEDFLNSCDQPSIDGFNTYCVAKHAHDCGMKVVLSGLGGDELFGGYPTFRQVPWLHRLGKLCSTPGALATGAARLIEGFASAASTRRVASLLRSGASLGASYWCARGIFSPNEAAVLAERYTGQEPDRMRWFNLAVPEQPALADQISWLEITKYMRNQLLRDSDVMSMAWGLELRVPFVDAQLLEAISPIGASLRLEREKQILRDAVPELPEWVTREPKRGFRFPFDQWLKDDWKDFRTELEGASPVHLGTWYRQWALLLLEHILRSQQGQGLTR